ncbi:MAG: TetR family transcriptional regulator [Caldimonas sp.]
MAKRRGIEVEREVPAWGNVVPSHAERAELKRSSIVRAAAQCFNRSGFHGTSMDDIAAGLGVTKAALYRYVTTKHELLFASFNMAMDSSFANLDRGEKEGANGLEKLRIALRGYLADLIGVLGHPVVLLEESALLPEQSRAIIARRDKAEARYRGLVAEGIADGSIAPCNPKLTVFAIFGAINWVPKWYRRDGELSADEVVESLVAFVTRSIEARPEIPCADKRTRGSLHAISPKRTSKGDRK